MKGIQLALFGILIAIIYAYLDGSIFQKCIITAFSSIILALLVDSCTTIDEYDNIDYNTYM